MTSSNARLGGRATEVKRPRTRMDDTKHRLVMARVAVLLVTGASALGCGSGGGNDSPSSSRGTTRSGSTGGPNARTESSPVGARVTSAAPSNGYNLVDDEARPPEPVEENHGRAGFLCSRDPVAFDLSGLTAGESTPVRFGYAWAYAKQHSAMPGFVIAYSGTASGPPIHGQVGAVRVSHEGGYAFMRRLDPTPAEQVSSAPENPFHVMGGFGRSDIVTAFGTPEAREGFVISRITVDGTLDPQCNHLRNVVVTMILPGRNVGQHFGTMTIDEALGPFTEDTDLDGKADGWSVTMVARSLDALTFHL